MARIFRFSGYYIDVDRVSYSEKNFALALKETISDNGEFQQLHVERSEDFDLDGEDMLNCDLALLTRHFKKDNISTEFDRALPKKGEKYRHFKLGKIVTVIGVSRHTETEELTVAYEYEGTIWNRPLEIFMSKVDKEKYPSAIQKYRFEKVENDK